MPLRQCWPAAWRTGLVPGSSPPKSAASGGSSRKEAEREGDATPAEWSRLSPEPPLPAELLVGLKTVELELGESPDDPMIGALVEMRHVLWVPVQVYGQLRGVLFAGWRKRQAPLPRALLESVAAELALAMELEDERRLGRERHEDSRSVLAALASSQSPSEILAGIVKDCTDKEAHRSSLGAVFAAIGRFVDSSMTRKEPAWPEARSIYFAWHSGDAAWIRALDSDPLSGVWRRAIESHRVAGSEPGAVWSHGDVARVMAFPLEAAGESLGVFVAGIRRDSASLVAVERLELRAALANSALLRQKQSEGRAGEELRHQTLLAAVRAATVVVRADGSIAHARDSARALLEGSKTCSRQTAQAGDPSGVFAELFSMTDVSRV